VNTPADVIPGLRRLAAVLLCLLVLSTTHAQTDNADLDRIRGEITRLRERLEEVRRERKTAELELEESDLELGIRTRELRIALDMQARLDRERAGLEGQIAVLMERIGRQKEYLRTRLVALYRLGSLSYVRLVLSLDNNRDPSAAIAMLSFLIEHDARVIADYNESRRRLDARIFELADRRRRIAQVAEVIETRRREVLVARAEKARIVASLRSEETGSARQIAELEEKARRLERLLDVLSQQEGGFIPSVDVRTFRGALAWPVDGEIVESFGRQRNAKFATYTMNNGLKIGADPNTEVRAVFQGTVLFAQWFKGYGNLIILDHGNRVFSLYGNVKGTVLGVGDRVTTGQAIAGVGESEDGQSGYLYFEIRQDNRPEDPGQWLR
jgi:septal ring factor EnvC (AmiA/AmiB activator)